MRRRVLVTGGAGFIGSHIVERLLGTGHAVGVLDDLSTGKEENLPAGVPLFRCDIRQDPWPAFVAFGPDAVVHQAAQVSVSRSVEDPVGDAQTNVIGSIRVLEAAREAGVRKVLYASSAAVYGDTGELPLREDSRPRPVSCYGASKYSVEHYLRTFGREYGMEWAALRYANVYGPRQDPHGEAGVVAIFVHRLLAGERPTVFGGGTLTRDYVHVEDVAQANLLALEADLGAHPDPVFNVSTGVPTSTNRVFEVLRDALAPGVEAVPGPYRAGDVEHSRLDNARFRGLTGWVPEIGVEDGLRRTAAHFATRAGTGG